MSKFFKNFKKFVKNTRQDRIYKDGLRLPDTPENLKTYGIPLYGMHIDEVIKSPIDIEILIDQNCKLQFQLVFFGFQKFLSCFYNSVKHLISPYRNLV